MRALLLLLLAVNCLACADFDGDGTVGVSDLSRLLLAWGRGSADSPADVDSSGRVDVRDLAILISSWGQSCVPWETAVNALAHVYEERGFSAHFDFTGDGRTDSRDLDYVAPMPLQRSSKRQAHSVARLWVDACLFSIRVDQARPTVAARNLWSLSVALWDTYVAFEDDGPRQLMHQERTTLPVSARDEALSHAAFRVLMWRFSPSVGSDTSVPHLREVLASLGLDEHSSTDAAQLGKRVAESVLNAGLADGSNELDDYESKFYRPVNSPMVPDLPGVQTLADPNRWQPLSFEFFVGQTGVVSTGAPAFIGPEWGQVTPFALEDYTSERRGGFDYRVYEDPGPPPYLGDPAYMEGFMATLHASAVMDPSDGVMLDISPGARGNNTLGTNDGSGRSINPRTGLPYEPQMVPAGDYFRVLAEFWADGPTSSLPPGHWNEIYAYVADQLTEKRFGGQGAALSELEFDVRAYLALNGALHDSAISAWGAKGRYDYVRPITAIRAACARGQSSDPQLPRYNPTGIPLRDNYVEILTEDNLKDFGADSLGKIAVRAWRGRLSDPSRTAGVGWILCEDWLPYQRTNFVSPAFAGYVSGHSTFSRAAAEMMTRITGDEYFPAGMGTFEARRNEQLHFEEGPSVDVTLQWATYRDAADECSISRIYGGIHPPQDDIPGRLMGARIAELAWQKVNQYISPQATPSPTPCPSGSARCFLDPCINGYCVLDPASRCVSSCDSCTPSFSSSCGEEFCATELIEWPINPCVFSRCVSECRPRYCQEYRYECAPDSREPSQPSCDTLHNAALPLDVNADGVVDSADVLALIRAVVNPDRVACLTEFPDVRNVGRVPTKQESLSIIRTIYGI